MSDLLGLKTKKVTTYGRRGNRQNIIPIHNDLSPVRTARLDDTCSSPSPATPLHRAPLKSKLSQGFNNIPQTISPLPKPKSTILVKPPSALRVSAAGSDSPRLVRRMHRPGRAIIPSSPSLHAISPSPAKSTYSTIHCVEIPSSVRRPRRAGLGKAGRYRELSQSVTDDLDRLAISTPVASRLPKAGSSSPVWIPSPLPPPVLSTPLPSRLARPASSSPVWIPSPLPPSKSLPALESVCSKHHHCSFGEIISIASSLSSPHSATGGQSPTIIKAGEATYSEVFSIKAVSGGDIVMKIIPITRAVNEVQTEDMPFRSPADDVAKEVEITKRVSGLEGGGFVEFFGAYLVRGKYDPHLLAEWDAYAESNRTENIRPSCFSPQQEYVVIFLSDGGDDLEAFQFSKKTGWAQAAGVFWQVADALARAEESTEFEHRDLHEGQILIDFCPADENCADPVNPNSTGVKATIIDFGLSRLLADGQSRVVSTAIPDEVLEGQGEQWDVYRAISKRVQGDWEGYHPITNLLWLQYILTLLLVRTSSLKRPKLSPTATTSRSRSTARVISSTRGRTKPLNADEERCQVAYAQLVSTKEAIEAALSGGRGRRGVGVKMGSAADLVDWARSKGFLL